MPSSGSLKFPCSASKRDAASMSPGDGDAIVEATLSKFVTGPFGERFVEPKPNEANIRQMW
jgi:hypothetical protein